MKVDERGPLELAKVGVSFSGAKKNGKRPNDSNRSHRSEWFDASDKQGSNSLS